ncbi:hypothetical protein [Kordiimonas sp.]|uniref:hypothetical protein n=1 Tax=Kordiimonas sp. TaxID=1970157 RepID=UPI003A95A683
MSNKKNISAAQMVDSFLRRTAVCVTIVAFIYGVQAFEFIAPAAIADRIDSLTLVLSILVLVLMLPSFLRFTIFRRSENCRQAEADSYMADRFKLAAHHAFTATFVCLILLQAISRAFEAEIAHLPVAFFLDMALAVSLGAFGVGFYLLVRENHDEDLDEWEQDE